MKRIGIMGGTFNPVHKGHLALAMAAQAQYALDEVVFIPSGNPPHKAAGTVIDKKYRLAMVKLAIKGKKRWSVSRLEVDRPGLSYAVDTFSALRQKYGQRAKLFYLMGLDSLNEIRGWKKPLELFTLCEFIVATRPGTRGRILLKETDKVHWLKLKEAVSASEVRRRLKAGKPVSKFVPARIAAYIKAKGLYQ
ncbi:MAG: nicotinate-nucleotide adenylyltransferase [Candidatus Margulisiibacteriota bacterium]